MTMMQEGIRYLDLLPSAALATEHPVPEIYADGIADITLHGAMFTATYFVWSRIGPAGLFHRVPVVRMVRERASIFGMREAIEAMQMGPSPSNGAH